MASGQVTKVYVGNMAWATDEGSLRHAFEGFGSIMDCHVMVDRETGRSRGFAFITYEFSDDAQKAVQGMHEKELDGRLIKVNLARPRENRGGQWR